ncbi:MAG: ribose-phosphate diphosphokinase [Desulfurococcales archaeon]|nr:ribose-phosphate diphosphokinase [Desulfurococcales archaeon]
MPATIVHGPGEASRGFAEGLGRSLGLDVVGCESKLFPDGEAYVRIPLDRLEGTAVIVHTMARPQDRSLLEVLMLVDAARGLGASSVVVVAPYTAYARQDTRFLTGEPVTISTVLKSIYAAGASSYFTVEIHKEYSLRHFPGRAYSVRPFTYMAKQVGLGRGLLFLAPDLGALPRARELASSLGGDYDYLVKRRDRRTGEISIEPKEINARGRDVVIVDDIISTGGTAARAARSLLEYGARSVTVMAAHLLDIPGNVEKLINAGVSGVIVANTLPVRSHPRVRIVDVAPRVGEELVGQGVISRANT